MREKARSERIVDTASHRRATHRAQLANRGSSGVILREVDDEIDDAGTEVEEEPASNTLLRGSLHAGRGPSADTDLGKLSRLVKFAKALGRGILSSNSKAADDASLRDGCQELALRTAASGEGLEEERCFQLSLRPDQLARLWLREDTLRPENVFVWSTRLERWIPAVTVPDVALALTRARIERVRMATTVNAALRFNCVPPPPRHIPAPLQRQLRSQAAARALVSAPMVPQVSPSAADAVSLQRSTCVGATELDWVAASLEPVSMSARKASVLLNAIKPRASNAYFELSERARDWLNALGARLSSMVHDARPRHELPVAVWPAAALSLLLGMLIAAGIPHRDGVQPAAIRGDPSERVEAAERISPIRHLNEVGLSTAAGAQGLWATATGSPDTRAPKTGGNSAVEAEYFYSRAVADSTFSSAISTEQGVSVAQRPAGQTLSSGASNRVEPARAKRAASKANATAWAIAAHFDAEMARRVIDRAVRRAVDLCTDREVYGDARLTFGSSGAVRSVVFASFTGDGSELECFSSFLQRVKVSAFDGAPLVTRKRFRASKDKVGEARTR